MAGLIVASLQTESIVASTMNQAYNTSTSTGSVFQNYSRAYSISLQTESIVFSTMNRAYNTLKLTESIFNTKAGLIVFLFKQNQ